MRRDDIRRLNRALWRNDSKIENALTGLGIPGVDSATATKRVFCPLSPSAARLEYRGSWAAQNEIDRPAKDLVREGFEIVDLPPWVDVAATYSYLSDLGDADVPEDRGVLPALSRLHAEGHKTKGAALVIVLDDGLPTWAPVDLARIRSIRSLELLECDEIHPWYGDAKTRVPEHYVIGTARTQLTPASIVHRSRVLLCKGVRLSPSEEWANNGWGASSLERLQSERMAMHTALEEMAGLILKGTVDAVYLAELEEMLSDEEGRSSVEERIALIARARGQHRLVPLDAGSNPGEPGEPGRPPDKFETLARPVEGVARLFELIEKHWASGTGQTPSIALGLNVGGLNTGEHAGDWQAWGSKIGGEQETWLRPRLEYLVLLAFAAKDGPTAGRIPEKWEITFPKLWQPTDLEREQVRQLRTATDNIMIAAKMVDAATVADQRLRQGNTGELKLEAVPAAATPTSTVEGEEPIEDDEEPDEVAVAFSTDPIPSDLMLGRDLAQWLTDKFGVRVTTNRITALRKAGKLRPFPLLGSVGYSQREALQLIAVDNGLIAGAEQQDDRADRGQAWIWRTQGDDRVRPEHAALEGRMFQAGERDPNEGEPGDAPNCRCWKEWV